LDTGFIFLYLVEFQLKPSVMAHASSKHTLSPAENELMDLLQHGDDFLKIELLRPAKSYYERALHLSPGDKMILEKIAECDLLIAFEKKVITVLVIVTAIIVAALLLF
jgi:hypothetical protein